MWYLRAVIDNAVEFSKVASPNLNFSVFKASFMALDGSLVPM